MSRVVNPAEISCARVSLSQQKIVAGFLSAHGMRSSSSSSEGTEKTRAKRPVVIAL
jgi:hypothetical protein